MVVVRAVVGSQRVGISFDGEFSFGDPVAIPTNDGTEIWVLLYVTAKLIKAKDDIGRLAIFIRHYQMRDYASEIGYSDLHPVSVAKGE